MKIPPDKCEDGLSASFCHLQLKVLKMSHNYYIACSCRNDSLPPGFLHPFLCHFSCSASYLVFNVGAGLSMFPSCFPGVFYFRCLIVLAVAYFGNNTSNTAGFFFLIKCFVLCEGDTLIIKI